MYESAASVSSASAESTGRHSACSNAAEVEIFIISACCETTAAQSAKKPRALTDGRPARAMRSAATMEGVTIEARVRRSQYSTSARENACGDARMSPSLMATTSYLLVTFGVSTRL